MYEFGLRVMKIISLIASAACIFGSASLHAEGARVPRYPTAQFPAPRSSATDFETMLFKGYYWSRYNAVADYPMSKLGFSLKGPGMQTTTYLREVRRGEYAETDREGRPVWFDGPAIVDLDNLVGFLLDDRKFADLDRLIDDWTHRFKKNADGRPTLRRFQYALWTRLGGQKEWEASAEIIKLWKAANPRSVGLALMEAEYWSSLAADARGGDWASNVTKEQWALYRERAQKGEKVLLESKSYAGDNPLWGMIYLQLTDGLGWSAQDRLKLFSEVAARHPDFIPYYFYLAEKLTPWWGGDWEIFDAFVRRVSKSGGTADGAGMYARIYWNTASMHPRKLDIFRDTRVDWPLMKKGFEALSKAYPHSAHNANAFAWFACAAGDGATYERVKHEIGASMIPIVWPTNLRPDDCDLKFRKKGI